MTSLVHAKYDESAAKNQLFDPNDLGRSVTLSADGTSLVSADGTVIVPPIVVSDSPPNNADGYPNGTLYFYAGA